MSALGRFVARWPALAALTACSAAGALCYVLHTPLPWMIGSLSAMAILKLAGVAVAPPRYAREAGQVVIATTLGLYFTRAVALQVLAYWELLLIAALFAAALAYFGAWILSRWTDTDRTTALFASVPGGAAEMANLGERFGARSDRIAIAQSLRILLVVLIVPYGITLSGAHGTDVYIATRLPVNELRLVLLLGCAATGGLLLWVVGSPNPFMLGPLGVAMALSVAGIQWSAVPVPLVDAAQVLLGCSLGSRFERDFVRRAPRYVFVVSVSIVVSIVVSALFAALLARWGGLAVATMVLATAPGGIAEMCVTAQALQLGVPIVTAAHVTRIFILVTTTAPIFRLLRTVTRPK